MLNCTPQTYWIALTNVATKEKIIGCLQLWGGGGTDCEVAGKGIWFTPQIYILIMVVAL